MEIIKEALIKECGNMFHDRVFVVENLPRKFLYGMSVKMVPRLREGFSDGSLVPDPKGELIETLHEGIEMSPTGDDGFMFWNGVQESENRLQDIDRFIERTLPRDARIPVRVEYAQRIGDAASPPMPMSRVPRVVLPVEADAVETTIPEAKKSDFRTAASDRMKKYWEDKKAQTQATTAS